MTVIQCPFVKFHVHDDNGFPASGWRLYTFKAGTDEPLTAYKDAAGTVEYGAYALLNARGEPDGDGFFLAENMAYKLILKRPDGSTAWSQPYVLPSSTGGGSPGASVLAARSVLGNASASPADAVAIPVVNVVADEPNAIPSAKAVFEAVQTVESEMVRNHGEQAIDGSLAVSGALSAGSLSVGGESIDDRYVRKAGHAGLSIVGRSEGGVGTVSDVPMVEALTSESNRASIPNAGAVLDALVNADTGMTRVTANDAKGFLAGKVVGDGSTANVVPNAEGTRLVVSMNQDLVNRIVAHEGQAMVDESDSLGYLGEKVEFGAGISGGVTEGKKILIQNSAPDTLQTKAHAASSIPGFLSALAVAGTGINIALSADMEKLVFTATGSAVGGFFWKGAWSNEGTYNANNAVWYFDHTGELPVSRLYIATTQNQGINPLADAGIGTGTCWSCMMAVDYMGDQFVMLDATDTQAGFLADKLRAGNYVTLTRNADANGAWYTVDTVAPYQVSIGGVVKDYTQLCGVLEFVGAGGCSAAWNGRGVQITGLALGTTSTTAARGDQGLTAYNHSQATHAPANADNTQVAISGAATKATPVDADSIPLVDSAAANTLKRMTWASIKTTIKSYLDTLYSAVGHSHAASEITSTATGGVAATNVQAAIEELESEKLSASAAASTYATIASVAAKQNALTFDTTPTNGSTNPVTSGGVYKTFQYGGRLVSNFASGNGGVFFLANLSLPFFTGAYEYGQAILRVMFNGGDVSTYEYADILINASINDGTFNGVNARVVETSLGMIGRIFYVPSLWPQTAAGKKILYLAINAPQYTIIKCSVLTSTESFIISGYNNGNICDDYALINQDQYIATPASNANDSRIVSSQWVRSYSAPISHASSSETYGTSTASNYGHSKASSSPPVMDGAAAVGNDDGTYARGDHKHPTDTSRLALGAGLSAGASTVVRAYSSSNVYNANTFYDEY